MTCTEWAPLTTGPVTEDISKLPFQFSRQCSYVHPQKKTAFVAATNAKVTQMQYLYVYGRGSGTAGAVDSARPRRGMVLTVSQFEGIPFSDYFKVLAYYGFDDTGSGQGDATSCTIRFGAAVHFCKSTMLKSQFQSGVGGELGEFAKHYFAYAKKRTEKGIAAAGGDVEPESDDTTPDITATSTNNSQSGSTNDASLLSNIPFMVCAGIIVLLVILILLQWRTNGLLNHSLAITERKLLEFESLVRTQLNMTETLVSTMNTMSQRQQCPS